MSEPAEVIDAQAVEEEATQPSQAVVPASAPSLAVAPAVAPAELVKRLDAIREAMQTAMQAGVDYGAIPGTGSKPTLLKPGAEKLGVLFQLDVQLANEKRWGPEDHLTVISRATVYHAPTGARLGYGEGVCSTREKKYAYRNAERTCPECGKANIRKSKQASDGFYCWRKTDGCGATFPADDERITSQEIGQVANPDIPDAWNTVTKMAEKRARIDAVLAVTGASALFTQDLEDSAAPPPGAGPADGAGEPAGTSAPDAGADKIGPRQTASVLKARRDAGMSQDSFAALLKTFGVDDLAELPKAKARELFDAITATQGDVPADTEGLPDAADEGENHLDAIGAES